MKKKNFVSLVMGTVGGILFALGMCMCMLPQWNAFTQGVVVSAVGAVVLLAMLVVRRKMEGKPAVRLNLEKPLPRFFWGLWVHWCLALECAWLWFGTC